MRFGWLHDAAGQGDGREGAKLFKSGMRPDRAFLSCVALSNQLAGGLYGSPTRELE